MAMVLVCVSLVFHWRRTVAWRIGVLRKRNCADLLAWLGCLFGVVKLEFTFTHILEQ